MKKFGMSLLVLSSVLVLGACGDSATSTENSEAIAKLEKTVDSLKKENEKLKSGQGVQAESSTTPESTTESSEPVSAFGLNEEAVYKNSEGEDAFATKIVKASTNQADFPDYMISMDDFDTANMIAVTIEFRNIALDDPFNVNTGEFIAYDASGKAYQQTSQQEGQDSVAAGRGSTSTMYWEVPNAGSVNEIEIDYAPYVAYGVAPTPFKVPVTH
ncbi:hypothetical protein [Enterococcus diestrammenae]|uniref:hypothetical protein n=1 Tax=Enterococcus diestrammenae TaxID=1155073 RepID=UPI0022E39492|nr:hypothetical protein [Enterococcus diestrammenae]